MKSLLLPCLAVGLLSLTACGGDATSSSTSGGGGDATTTASSTTGGEGGAGGASTSTTTVTTGTSTGTGAGGAGGAGGAPTPECEAMEAIVLSDATVSADWNPGEAATVIVTMTNTSNVDINYPGVRLLTNVPGVTGGQNTFFQIGANTSMPLDITLDADLSVAPGTIVPVEAVAIDIMNTICTNVPTLELEATVE